jgi:hypothetical protein
MTNDHLAEQLGQPLEGDRCFVRTTRGKFTLRHHPEHLATIKAEKARLRVQADVTAYRRMITLRQNLEYFA